MPEAIDFENSASQYMEMPSGKWFYMAAPDFDIEDIAYTLAGQPRFNGTGARNQHDHSISVAEHSVRASYMILTQHNTRVAFYNDRIAALTGLMHDVTEAFLGDVPGPWKALLPDFCKLEEYLWGKICEWINEEYGVTMPLELPPEMKYIDYRCLFLEAREVMQTQGRDWVMSDAEGVMPTTWDAPLYWWSPAEAEQQFLRRFYELVS